MEELNVGYGLALYRATSPVLKGTLKIPRVRDRSYVYVDRKVTIQKRI
jgi:hypothetical protein